MGKNILYGIIAAIVFGIITTFVGMPIGMLLFAGDSFILSYHMFSYMGLILLCGVMITCTVIIAKKIDLLIAELKNNKQ